MLGPVWFANVWQCTLVAASNAPTMVAVLTSSTALLCSHNTSGSLVACVR